MPGSLPFEVAADVLRDAVFLLDAAGEIQWANRAAAEAAGRSADLLRGILLAQILTPRSAEMVERMLKFDAPSLLEAELVRPDLTARRLEIGFNRLSQMWVAIGRDVSPRSSLDAERRRADFQTLQYQFALLELARAEPLDLDDGLARITAVAATTLDTARAGVWLFDDAHTEIRCLQLFDRERGVHEKGAVIDASRFPRDFGALEENRAIAARDTGAESMLVIPIRREGQTIGVLCHEHTGSPRDWNLDERNFGASLADQAALLIETDRRQKAEHDLRRSFDQLELFFSQSLDGFFFMMLDQPIHWNGDDANKERILDYVFERQRVTKVNDAMLGQYGASRERFVGSTPRDFFAHDIAHGRQLWRRMFDAGRLHVESDERKLDGSRMWVEGDYICFFDAEGRITGHFGIQRDITGRKQADEELKRSNKRLKLLHRTDRSILSAQSVDEIAHAAMQHLGDFGFRMSDFGDVDSWISDAGFRISDTGGAFSAEDTEIAQEVADSLAVAIRHAHLNQQVAAHAAELERTVAERTAELSESNARLSGILRSAMDAILVIDSSRRIVIFNEAAAKVLRCSSAVIGESAGRFLSADLASLLDNYMAADSRTPKQLWVPEGMCAVRQNGEHFPIEGTISRAEVTSGTLFTVILRDIDERKQVERIVDQLQRENVYLQEELQSELNFGEIVGVSAPMRKVFSAIEMVAATDSTVLLLGETGAGKELIARALHNHSRRKQNVMVRVNCAALTASLVESELFGHERGAFTGAVAQKKGRFELANRGTVFLDEVGELPLETQSKLLRVLQEQEFERVGGAQTIRVDVRVIAATNRNLAEEVRRGAFRADLYYRLNVFPIEAPPLRRRKEDITPLATHFVRKFSQRMGKRIHSISAEAFARMQRYDWPGNVRELANVMERAVILCQGSVLQDEHVAVSGPPAPANSERFPTLEDAERQLVLQALERTGGVLAGPNGAARLLGLNRSTLWSRMRKLGIESPGAQGVSS